MEVDGVTYDIDLLLSAMFSSQAMRREPFTPEEWERQKETSKTSVAMLRRELFRMIDDGTFPE